MKRDRRALGTPDRAFLPPPGLSARRFAIEGDHYVLLEFPLPALALPESLTPAERDVARRVAEGERPREIAKARSTSIHTVGNQIRSIYAKLEISSRAELLRLCRVTERKERRRRRRP